MRKRPLLWIACVFLTGLAYERYKVVWLLLVPLVFLMQELLVAIAHSKWRLFAGRSVVLLSAFLFGCVHMQSEEVFRDHYLSKLEDGNRVTIWGEIKSIDTTEYGCRCVFTDCYIRIHEEESVEEDSAYTEQKNRIACNDVMVYTSSTHYQVGQIHRITGQFKRFSEDRNQGNFDSQVFYQSQKIDFIVEAQSNTLLAIGQSRIEQFLVELRKECIEVFYLGMSEHAAGFYAAMVMGDKSNLSEETKDLFATNGISHILAISGLHVSIIGRQLYMSLRKKGKSFLVAGILAGVVLLIYCYMVGGGMSTLRAVGMMLLYFLAQYWGKSYDMLNGLGGMCLLLLWENPFLLEYSGFWFSVLALLGIGIVGPALGTSSLCMGLGVTLSTLPIVACNYYEIPLYATLVNMIVLPILSPIFLLAVVGVLIGLWLPAVVSVLFVPCEWLLIFYEWLCDWVKELPAAIIICGKPTIGVVVAYYVILLIGISKIRIRENQKECEKNNHMSRKETLYRRIGIVGVCVTCFLSIIYTKSKPFEISFLDVGQGDGIYISIGDGTTCFIDGGSTSVNRVGNYRILPFLKAKGVSTIDYWFVTHADTDHISGVLEVLSEGYQVSHLVVAKAAPNDENMKALTEAAKKNETKVIYMKAGDEIITPFARLRCLYPKAVETVISQEDTTNIVQEKISIDRNAISLVLELEIYNGVLGRKGYRKTEKEAVCRVLFTGDITSEVEAELIDLGVFSDVDIYKAAHHGSKYSNSEALLHMIQPEHAVVSCAKENLYGHPAPETIERMHEIGAEVFYTMESGQLTVHIMNDTIKMSTYFQKKSK